MTKLKTPTAANRKEMATTTKKGPTKRTTKAARQPIEEDEEDGPSGVQSAQNDHEMKEIEEDQDGEEEISENEEDEEDAASKAAELALTMTRDVDINGGWKAGAP